MEKDFQTSFIPKKPILDDRSSSSRPAGFLVVISILILITVLVATGALYLYKSVLKGNIAKMENDLNLAKNRFEPAKIVQLQVLDKRLKGATEILSNHVAISPIFKALQLLTMKTVRYTKFGYDFDSQKSAVMQVKMSGEAIGYRSVALQSDLFLKNKFLIDPVFSNLSLDNSGNVLFDLTFSVDPTFIDYKQMLLTENGDPTAAIPTSTGGQ